MSARKAAARGARNNKAWPGPQPASDLPTVPSWPRTLGEGCQAGHSLTIDAKQALSLAVGSLWAA